MKKLSVPHRNWVTKQIVKYRRKKKKKKPQKNSSSSQF